MSSAGPYSSIRLNSRTRVWGNLLLALFKGAAGWLTGSKALAADALRSAADAALCLVPKVSGRFAIRSSAKKEKYDARHEMMSALLVSVALLVVGLEIGVTAIQDIVDGVTAAPQWYALGAIASSMFIRILFLRSEEGLSGVYCSLVSLIGAGVASAGGMLAMPMLYYFDPAAAILIAAIVVHKGYRTMAAAIAKGQRLEHHNEEDPQELVQFVNRIEGVISVASLKAREDGHYVAADIIIAVNPRLSIVEGNIIAKRVKLLLMKRFPHIKEVHIFVEPYDAGLPYKSNHDPNQEQLPTLLQ